MKSHKSNLLSSTMIQLFVGAGVAAGGFALSEASFARGGDGLANPAAVAKPADGAIRLAACKACNPCAAKKACNPCNPCAAKKACGGCNPCAAKRACNPCNPCAASNPCNPCGGACNPCGGAAAPELTTAEAKGAYECLVKEMLAGYKKSGMKVAGFYKDWDIYNNQPYVSDTHGGRFVNNYANATARNYGKFEDVGRLPVGAMLAKDSFAVHGNGKTGPGPLFLMEKMPAGFNKASGNWRYTMVMPDGAIFGVTNGQNSAKMQFCIDCHAAVADDQDSVMLLPDEYRVKSN